MNLTPFAYFTLGALSLFVGILIKPTLDNVYKRIVAMFKRKPRKASTNDFDAIKTRLDELEKYTKQKEYNHVLLLEARLKNTYLNLKMINMEPLGRKPKNRENKVLQTVRITREEYNDYQNMKGFIYENQLLMKFEMYVDLINHMKNQQLLDNDENATKTNLLD
jgi:hypothetical protein